MKTILAVALFLIGSATLQAQDSYVVVGAPAYLGTVEGTKLLIRPGDVVEYMGLNDTKTRILFRAANRNGSLPWDHAKIVAKSDDVAARALLTEERLRKLEIAAYQNSLRNKEAAQKEVQNIIKEAGEARRAREQAEELRRIRQQLELLNLQRR